MFRPETREQKKASYRKVKELSDAFHSAPSKSEERKNIEQAFFAACSLTD